MNLPDLTGGPIGSIGMLGPGKIAMYNGGWQALLIASTARLAPLFGAPPSAATR